MINFNFSLVVPIENKNSYVDLIFSYHFLMEQLLVKICETIFFPENREK